MVELTHTPPRAAAIVQRSTGHPDLILIEDNPQDVRLMQLALEEAGVKAHLHVAGDSVAAFDLMTDPAIKPAVVVLDLNLPLIAGAAILREIRKAGARWQDVPVVVLTSSQRERDIDDCIELGANAYKLKPAVFEDYAVLIRYLATFLGRPTS
jgi:chemotaxis family two-component system response regulator Rcp1